MLEALRRLWRSLEGWSAWRRHRAHVRRLAARDPVEAHLTELCLAADERGIETLTAAAKLDAEDDAMFDLGWDDLRAAIARYMRSNPRDFPGLPRRSPARV